MTAKKLRTEEYLIRDRWSGDVTVTAAIECAADTPWPLKLGLAVRWAIANRANLDGANLDGANLDGANLDGANLDGALIRDKKIKRLIAIVPRLIEPYVFNAFETQEGEIWIMAGCRFFTPDQYVAHVADEYPDTPKAAETLEIIDYIEMRARALGVTPVELVVA